MSLVISNLKKRFGDKVIFDGFSYSFPEKGLFLIRGNSGIGKTTLLRIIAGLDNSYSGTVKGGGYKNVSYAFQEYRLFPTLTARENVTVASFDTVTSTLEEAASLLFREFGLSESDLALLPSELSGGMKQRISLIRAILKKSKILLLDEPTKELDPELAYTVRKRIQLEAKERLVIMVSHLEDGEILDEYTELKI